MNAAPHIHVVRLRRTYDYGAYDELSHGGYLVEYGDTKVHYAWWWQRPHRWSSKRLERRVARSTARAVRRHDRGSIKAGEARDKQATARRVAEDAARSVTSQWESG